MSTSEQTLELGKNLKSGDHHYRAYVGPPRFFDLIGAAQFNLLTALGLREEHKVLDIGCGSLRAGRLLIPYLLPGNYFGIEPENWLLTDVLEKELSNEFAKIRKPQFDQNDQFDIGCFNEKFDFMIAQSIFTHCARNLIEKCLYNAVGSMSDNCIFAFTYKEGSSDYVGNDEWVYPETTPYKPGTIIEMVEQAGMKCDLLRNWIHPNGLSWAIAYLPKGQKHVRSLKTTYPNSLKNLSFMARTLRKIAGYL